jgi:hypothetical protein
MRLRPHTSVVPGQINPPARWQRLHEYETHRIPVGARSWTPSTANFAGAIFFAERNPKTGTAPSFC